MAFAISLFFVIFLSPTPTVSQTNGNIKIGSSLMATDSNASSSWISASGDFAFGFLQLENTDLFLVSIWYNKIPEKTIVWYSNGDNPAPRGSILQLSADRGLFLTDPYRQETLVSDPIIGSVAYGVMEDTGNFMLANRNSESLWRSFDHATDTILPTQTMGQGPLLSSRRKEANFSRGRFQLSLVPNGSIELGAINLPGDFQTFPYYSNGTGNSSNISPFQLFFNNSGYLYISGTNEKRFVLSYGDPNASTTDLYHRITLSFDGVLAHYTRPKDSAGNQSWSVSWLVPDNICISSSAFAGSGVCGYNRICRLTIDRRPDCQCPNAFSLVDPNDDYTGCVPDFLQGCKENYQYEFETITNIDWPTSDYDRLEPNYDEEKCKDSCLQDCMCAVAILRDNTCWKKKLPLSNGRVDSSLNGKAFIKINKGNNNPPPDSTAGFAQPDKKNQNSIVLIISVFLGGSLFVNLILIGLICLGFFLIYKNKLSSRNGEKAADKNLQCFTYKDLQNATNGFEEELGRGSFGIVYKGVLKMGSADYPVAVKKLDRIMQDGEKEFRTEVNVIGQTHHKNLVRLLGFCDEETHRLLIYEFLNNGNLANFLFGDLKLTWNQRAQIAIGIARGLLYLHEECSTQIIHCDVKPQNILLDNDYNPRISDFGLAKLLRIDQSDTYTGIRGTKGYVAPEWFRNMGITVKADVYSFGVLLLEIICCRKNVDLEIGGDRAILTYWAYDCYIEGTVSALVEKDAEALSEHKRLERFLMVAIWCVQEDPSLRPTMKKVVLMLEGIVEVISPPCPSPFSNILSNSTDHQVLCKSKM